MNWLKEWDKCVFKRIPPGKKRRLDDPENVPVGAQPASSMFDADARRSTRSADPENVYDTMFEQRCG